MKVNLTITVLMVATLVCFSGEVSADDLNPPGYRNGSLSYFAEWDAFGHFSNPLGFFPDTESNVDDSDPNTNLYSQFNTHIDFDAGGGWILTQPGGIQNPSRPASFVTNVVNWVDFLPEKQLRVQVTYTGAGSPTIGPVTGFHEGAPHGSELLPDSAGTPVGGFGDGVSYFYEDWVIHPNPDWEQIQFNVPQGTIVEQIVIDTISIPEPTTMALAGVCLVGLLSLGRPRK